MVRPDNYAVLERTGPQPATNARIQRNSSGGVADERARNRARAEREIPEAIFLFDELVKHGMSPTMKKLEFHVEQKEAA